MNKRGCLLSALSLLLIIPMIIVLFFVGMIIQWHFDITFDGEAFTTAAVSIVCIIVYLASCVKLLPSLRNLSIMSKREIILTMLAILIPLPLMFFAAYGTITDSMKYGNPFAYRPGFEQRHRRIFEDHVRNSEESVEGLRRGAEAALMNGDFASMQANWEVVFIYSQDADRRAKEVIELKAFVERHADRLPDNIKKRLLAIPDEF